ncbi:G5 domain-containing protein, partial [Corynebacterium amycolatum]
MKLPEVLKKRSVRAPLAVLTVTAVVGSAIGVAPNFVSSPPEAVAAELSGGIREKSGAVEKDAQKASDLPAGSCVVSENAESGSQAGFSWNTSEPSATSPNKKAWGLSVSFDNSQDRTFADWGFTSGGRMGAYLDAAQIPAMDAGQTFVDKVVTHKADEILGITASGPQRNLNLYAELTDVKVKQFAEATAANPVRYAWQGHYKLENPTTPRATQGPNSTFTAVVNPWPSENIECNPITVSWESFEKHVIVPGTETKVGKINIPAVVNGGTDDSMSRMVVEAYDGNGKFIGTTDPAASGGTKNLRIDEATGEIFFTWPEYRGTDLATDKNVNFSVLAKPRSVDQLQAAAKSHNEFIEHDGAFNSSNSLTRYNKANVIDSKAFSLDDTEYHSPKYDKEDASIISGVDSATGPLATEPQKVVFKQVPDKIKDLVKKKGDGGFEAKVELDEKYVYEGWTVEMDEDYNVTVTAPENPKPGTFARPKVIVEYSNGSTDELELLVVVDPNNTQVTDLVRPGLAKGKVNEDITSQITTKSIMKGHKPVHPAKFEIDPSTVPEGWTVKVDDTGKVTAKADDSVAPGTVITPKVKATYPDQTTDEIEVQFQAIVDIKIPTYDTVTGQPNANVSLTPELPERGLSGNTSDEAPTRYTFEDGTNQTTLKSEDGKTWTVYVDEKTGEIKTTIPRDAHEGDILNVPVLAHYSDEGKQKPQTVVGTVVVIKGDLQANYDVQTTGPGQSVEHHVDGPPEGSTFSFGQKDGKPVLTQNVDGWEYKVDPNTGVVTSTPPADAKPGDKNTVTVTVNAPGGRATQTPVTTVVKLTNAWEADPSYPTETVYPGDTAKLPLNLDKPDNVNVAKDNPYELGEVPAGWTVSIDDNGEITATAPADAKPGDQVKIPVTVTYEDGSTDTAYAVVNVVDVPTREVPFKVEYKYDDTIPAGEYKVETKGVPGKEKMTKDGQWEQTEAPVNEVVVIGTKVTESESAETVTWTVPIPYPTEVRENPDLAPGEIRVVQEGENGEKTFTANFTAKGDKAEVTEEKTTKEPVTRIIEYGPGVEPSELVTKTEKPIPFETEIVFDDTLEKGKQVVDQEGQLGTEVETSTQKIVDGKPSGGPKVTTERTKEPVKQIIRVGTKTVGTHTTEYEVDVPFETEIIFDENLEAGTQETVQEGKLGKDKVTTTQTIENSTVVDSKTETVRVAEPVKKIIKVGTKGKPASTTIEWTEKTPFEVEVRVNPELKPGETKVVQEGKQGEIKHTVKVNADNGEISTDESSEKISDPVNQIIEVGPAKGRETALTDKHTEKIPYDTLIEYDPNLEVGRVVEEQAGEFGEKEITKTWKLENGEPVGDPEISETVTKDKQDRKIRVGTKCKCEPTPPVDPSEPTDPTEPTEPTDPSEPT